MASAISQAGARLDPGQGRRTLRRALRRVVRPRSPDGKPRRLPLIVNGSFASMAGPQDGYSDVEKRITQFLETYRGNGPKDLCTFVLSAGNSLQLRAAAQMDILPGKSGEIPWRVLPDDKTPNFVQIWLPEARRRRPATAASEGLSRTAARRSRERTAFTARCGRRMEDWGAHWRPYIPSALPETRRLAGVRYDRDQTDSRRPGRRRAVVPSGLWRIRVKNTTDQELGIDLRVHRDDVGMFARTGARQSYFDDPNYEMFEPGSGRPINDERRDGGREDAGNEAGDPQYLCLCRRRDRCRRLPQFRRRTRPIFVCRLCRQPHRFVIFHQPARQAWAPKPRTRRRQAETPVDGPDLAAVSEESPALAGVLAAGTYSGSVAILGGTSVAAPQITRALADEIAARRLGRKPAKRRGGASAPKIRSATLRTASRAPTCAFSSSLLRERVGG